jgi:hypothetical protein
MRRLESTIGWTGESNWNAVGRAQVSRAEKGADGSSSRSSRNKAGSRRLTDLEQGGSARCSDCQGIVRLERDIQKSVKTAGERDDDDRQRLESERSGRGAVIKEGERQECSSLAAAPSLGSLRAGVGLSLVFGSQYYDWYHVRSGINKWETDGAVEVEMLNGRREKKRCFRCCSVLGFGPISSR